MKRATSTGNMISALLGSNTNSKNAEFSSPSKTKTLPSASALGEDKPERRRRSRSSTRLTAKALPRRANTLDGSAKVGFSLRKGPMRRCNTMETSPAGSCYDDISARLGEVDLKAVPHKSEEELLSDIFKTAGELEELAKAARKARRRKNRPPRRCKSSVSEATFDDSPVAASPPDDDDCSVRSNRSLRGLLSPLLGPAKEQKAPNTTGGRRSRSRGASITRLMGRGFSTRDPKVPEVPVELEIPKGSQRSTRGRARRSRSRSRRLETPKPMENPYAPSFYHDSDDDDDSLVLNEHEKMTEYEKKVESEVKNMTICITTPCTTTAA